MNRSRKFKLKPWSVIGVISVVGLILSLFAISTMRDVSAQDIGLRPIPTLMASPTPSATKPSSGIPKCPEALHDPHEWHALFDSANNCHFDHEHKHDPNEVADIFGPAGEWFGGTSISYPWETEHENMHKHEAYNWIVRRDVPQLGRALWIKDFRWQIHAISAPFTDGEGNLHGGYLGRYHSYSLEANVCSSSGQCGIVRTGGWIDFGHLEINKIDNCVDLPHDPSQQETCINLGRRRIHYYNQTDKVPKSNSFFWYGRVGHINGPNPEIHSAQVAVATSDGTVNVVPGDLYTLHFFCPNWDCHLNNSTMQAHLLSFSVPRKYDPDNDGLSNVNGYTDRYGVMVEGCSEPSLDCVPFILDNAPHGDYRYQDVNDMGLLMGNLPDFDTSPPGEWWIEYPEPPMPMEPSPTPLPGPGPQPTRGPKNPSLPGDAIIAPLPQMEMGSGKP